MKFQTFNRSCSYVSLANLLFDFSINVEDFEIIQAINIPYMFHADKGGKYLAGPMLQGKKWFDYYLNSIGFEFVEKELESNEVLELFDSTNIKLMLGLKLGNLSKHSVIYSGKENNKYRFINSKWPSSVDPNYLFFDVDKLLLSIDSYSTVGWIERINSKKAINNLDEIDKSLYNLENYKHEVVKFCTKINDVSTLEKAKYELFEPLFLDIFSMMQIINEIELVDELKQLRSDYLYAMKLKLNLVLSDYISIYKLEGIINKYIDIIKKFKEQNLRNEI